MTGSCPIRATGTQRWTIVPRLLAMLPLAGFGAFHMTGMTPLMEILTRASIPLPGINYYVAPLVMVVAGLSLGLGFFARIGAVLGMGAMAVATYSKMVITEWPGSIEPPIALPVVVFVACGLVLWKGAGAWSVDRRMIERQATR